MSVKSIKKQLAAAIAMVLVAAVALGSSTYAWFAAQRTVTATGMSVTAQTSQSLVISNTVATNGVGTANTTDLSAANPAVGLNPARHYFSDEVTVTGTDTDSSNLYYNANATQINSATGLAEANQTLSYKYATKSGGYYVDYICYLGAAGGALDDQTLTIEWNDDVTAVATIMNAVSIDFYLETVTDLAAAVNLSTYIGTLNVAQIDAQQNDYSTQKNAVTVNHVDIPINTQQIGTGALRLVARTYIDGALLSGAGQAYINTNDSVNVAAQAFSLKISAAD